jgi:hypothetical protein
MLNALWIIIGGGLGAPAINITGSFTISMKGN